MKMKFTTAAVVLMAGVAGLLSSCKQEQSSYTMDSLQGTATITGVVKYNPGYQEVASGESVLDGYYVPVEGVTVNVNVPYSSLGISGSGKTRRPATYDKDITLSHSVSPSFSFPALPRHRSDVYIPVLHLYHPRHASCISQGRGL